MIINFYRVLYHKKFYTGLRVEVKTLKSLIDTVKQISEERFHEKDLIGRVYEYFLQYFAIDERKEKGEFYTPRCIVDLMGEYISGTIESSLTSHL